MLLCNRVGKGGRAKRKRRNGNVKKLIIAMVLIALPVLFGCGKTSDRSVIAKVNQTRITVGDLKNQIADLSPETLHMIATDPKARKSVLDDVIAFELVLQEARRQGLENVEFTKRQETLRKEMERRIQDEARNELVGSLLRKELADKLSVKPTDAEVKEFYDKYKDKMVTADGRKVGLQEAAPEIRNRLMTMKQRDVYMEYANKLRDKAKITINEEALQSLATSLSQSPGQGGPLMKLPVPKEEAGQEKDQTKK
jgi:FKBP-type peptidyl-prolyl cis-trans isomerase (trigger factor)